MPQPGHQVIPIALKGHKEYCGPAAGLLAPNAIKAAIQKTSSKFVFKNLINFV
jgi:hypothetical protein